VSGALATQPLRVLFATRADLREAPGGDTYQVLGTARALEALGVEVTVGGLADHDPARFDIVHVWHLERTHESYLPLRRARQAGVPVALSPIYWPEGGVPRRIDGGERLAGVREDLKNLVRLVRSGREARAGVLAALRAGWSRARHELLHHADLLLPNSHAEAEVLRQELACHPRGPAPLMEVVVNAADLDLARRVLAEPEEAAREGVACVGHFDVRKNQRALIEAVRGTGIRLTLVGGARRNHAAYERACRRIAPPNVVFAGALPPVEALRVMRRARVHVCPSRFETPGLVNLEAGFLGCALVLPDCPPVREYFGPRGRYARPDPGSLRAALREALDAGPDPDLPGVIERSFTWARAAEQTLAAYRRVISNYNRRG
jgi:glycosyltransferase involved in cell wall biosynthesis